MASPTSSEASTLRNQGTFDRNQGRESRCFRGFTSDLRATPQGARVGSPDFAAIALRQLFGNAHLYESETSQMTPILVRFELNGDVRELVRDVAKSESFRKRFFDPNTSIRFVEICFKLLLGRGPSSQAEVSEKIQMLADATVSYDDFIDSFVDCAEYAERFGPALLPTFDYPGGFYQNGMVGFMSNMKMLVPTRGACTCAVKGTSLTQSVLTGINPATADVVSSSYATMIPSRQAFRLKKPQSVLEKNYARSSLWLTPAVSNWSGLGQPRPTGKVKEAWSVGWAPSPKDEWSAGWTPTPKRGSTQE